MDVKEEERDTTQDVMKEREKYGGGKVEETGNDKEGVAEIESDKREKRTYLIASQLHHCIGHKI